MRAQQQIIVTTPPRRDTAASSVQLVRSPNSIDAFVKAACLSDQDEQPTVHASRSPAHKSAKGGKRPRSPPQKRGGAIVKGAAWDQAGEGSGASPQRVKTSPQRDLEALTSGVQGLTRLGGIAFDPVNGKLYCWMGEDHELKEHVVKLPARGSGSHSSKDDDKDEDDAIMCDVCAGCVWRRPTTNTSSGSKKAVEIRSLRCGVCGLDVCDECARLARSDPRCYLKPLAQCRRCTQVMHACDAGRHYCNSSGGRLAGPTQATHPEAAREFVETALWLDTPWTTSTGASVPPAIGAAFSALARRGVHNDEVAEKYTATTAAQTPNGIHQQPPRATQSTQRPPSPPVAKGTGRGRGKNAVASDAPPRRGGRGGPQGGSDRRQADDEDDLHDEDDSGWAVVVKGLPTHTQPSDVLELLKLPAHIYTVEMRRGHPVAAATGKKGGVDAVEGLVRMPSRMQATLVAQGAQRTLSDSDDRHVKQPSAIVGQSSGSRSKGGGSPLIPTVSIMQLQTPNDDDDE
jgi:hypothetical protein